MRIQDTASRLCVERCLSGIKLDSKNKSRGITILIKMLLQRTFESLASQGGEWDFHHVEKSSNLTGFNRVFFKVERGFIIFRHSLHGGVNVWGENY